MDVMEFLNMLVDFAFVLALGIPFVWLIRYGIKKYLKKPAGNRESN